MALSKASRLLLKLRSPAPPVTRVFKTCASEDIRRSTDIINSSSSSSPPPIDENKYNYEIRSTPSRFYARRNELEMSIEEVVIEGEYADPENPTRGLLNMISPLHWLRPPPPAEDVDPPSRSLITLINVVSPICGLRSTPIYVRKAKETAEGLCLRLLMPGIRLEDVRISIKLKDRLVIEGEGKGVFKHAVGGYTSMVVLPENIYDTSNIKRDKDFGVLTLNVPKKQSD